MPSLLQQIYTFLPFMVFPVDLLRFLSNLPIWSVLAVTNVPGMNTVQPSTAVTSWIASLIPGHFFSLHA